MRQQTSTSRHPHAVAWGRRSFLAIWKGQLLVGANTASAGDWQRAGDTCMGRGQGACESGRLFYTLLGSAFAGCIGVISWGAPNATTTLQGALAPRIGSDCAHRRTNRCKALVAKKTPSRRSSHTCPSRRCCRRPARPLAFCQSKPSRNGVCPSPHALRSGLRALDPRPSVLLPRRPFESPAQAGVAEGRTARARAKASS